MRSKGISEDFAAFQTFLKDNPIMTLPPHESNRVNHASVLLLWNTQPPGRVKKFVELGCGSGFISFGLAKLFSLTGTGIDIQQNLQTGFEEGARANAVADKVQFLLMDIADTRAHLQPEMCDLCVFNPPHYIVGRGEKVLDETRELSRTSEVDLFEDYADAVSYLLKTKGIFSCVLAPNNLEEWMQTFSRHKLFVKSILPVYGNPESDARLILIRGIKNSKSSFVKFRPAVFLK